MSEAPVAKKVVESVSKETYFSEEKEAKAIELLKELLSLMEAPSEEDADEPKEEENEVVAEEATEPTPAKDANLASEEVESEVELSELPSEEPTAVAPKNTAKITK